MDVARTRVKICGLTREQDVASAVRAGADAVGFVFYPKSSRFVTPERAGRLRAGVPTLVDAVALFVNAEPAQVKAVIDAARPDVLQFHGDESPEYCRQFGRAYWRAFRVGGPGLETPEAVLDACRRFPDAAGWLFDSYSAGYGGSGLRLDVSLLRAVRAASDSRPLILAGGMTPGNVAEIISEVRPYAVDVSSGVEVSGGIKSDEKIHALMAALPSNRTSPLGRKPDISI